MNGPPMDQEPEYTPTSPSFPRPEPTHDTLPAPEAHPVEAEILASWERGLPYHDSEEEGRAFREGMAYLLRRASQ